MFSKRKSRLALQWFQTAIEKLKYPDVDDIYMTDLLDNLNRLKEDAQNQVIHDYSVKGIIILINKTIKKEMEGKLVGISIFIILSAVYLLYRNDNESVLYIVTFHALTLI